MENQINLLISAFIVIILGVVLIGPIGDDVELVKTSSYDAANETVTLSAAHTASTGTLTNDKLISLSALRNETSDNIIGHCNITLVTGGLKCNATNSTTAYADYIWESNTPYIRGATTKTLITLVILFFAIAILAIGLGFAVKAFKDAGVF